MGISDKNFIVYKASAGSGKTYTLVKEYLEIVLTNPEKYRRVLAVTFTNKAAYEMKTRIIKYLVNLSKINKSTNKADVEQIKNSYKELINELCSVTRVNVNELSCRADIVLKKILHNYTDFAICTIDSFVQRIIRTFAFDLKIPQNFEVELDSKNILSQAVDILLSFVNQGEAITELMVEFIKQKISEGKSWDIEKDLKSFAEELLKEDTQKFIPLIEGFSINNFQKIISKSFEIRKTLSDQAETMAKSVLIEINRLQIDITSFYYGTKGIPGFFKKIISKGLANATLSSTYYIKTVEENEWFSKKAPAQDIQNIDSLKDMISEAYHKILELQIQFKNINIVTKSLYQLSLLNQIRAETDEVKSNSNLVFISDFYQKIHEQLLNEPVPFIYQRTGEKYEHFFIDEFQDTSVLQFQNMLPLIDNSLATANTNLVVGDGKQAIYRWRNGEVMQFASLPKIFNKPDLLHFDYIESSLERNFINYADTENGALNINYRSQREIVNFNNKLFGYLSNLLSEKHRNIYDNISQNVKPGSDRGYIKVQFFDAEDYEENQLNAILEVIQNLSIQNIPLNNIAVICRKNFETIIVAAHLLKNNIEVVSSESLLLCASSEINLIISSLKFLHNADDNLSASYILFYLSRNRSTVENTNTLIERYNTLRNTMQGFAALSEILKSFNIEIDFNVLAKLSLFDLNEYLIRKFGLMIYADPFIIFYLDAVSQFTQKNTSTIFDFLRWWDEFGAKKSIVIPDELNAVKIMTIHKAKGMEFPVVIYPFADESPVIKNASTWVLNQDKITSELPVFQLQISEKLLKGTSYEKYFIEEKSKATLDMLNICYVALTRAGEHLYIFSKKYADNSKSQSFGVQLQKYLTLENLWVDGKTIYEFGHTENFILNAVEKRKENNLKFYDSLVSSDWTKKLIIRYSSPQALDFDKQDKRLSWGNMVHEILSEMQDMADMDKAIAETVQKFMLNEEDSNKIRKLIAQVFSKPEMEAFFAPGLKVMTESEILTADNKLYRPDRIIFDNDNNIVIDFKTGAAEEKHQQQISNYAALLTDINKKPTEKFLLYLNENVKLVKV